MTDVERERLLSLAVLYAVNVGLILLLQSLG